MNPRESLIRLAASFPSGDPKRLAILKRIAGLKKTAFNEKTAEFVDWVLLNKTHDPMSAHEFAVYMEQKTGNPPAPYVAGSAAPKRGPDLEVGDLVRIDSSKAPPSNQDIAGHFDHQIGTVDKVEAGCLLVKLESGQIAKFVGTQSGMATGLYRHTPMVEILSRKPGGALYEFVYFSKPGEVGEYRKHVVEQYKTRGLAKGEDRQGCYYSGNLQNFKVTKENHVVATFGVQNRAYPVTINPAKGTLLYVGVLGKRPSFEADFERDVAEIAAGD